MSDYEGDDDYDDYDEWMYVEEEYTPADDLAEHAINSPPPTAYADEDAEEFDRFEYFIDLDYASDGFDDPEFYVHKADDAKTGQKRKLGAVRNRRREKRQKLEDGLAAVVEDGRRQYSPVVWRAQSDRGVKVKMLDEKNTETYALQLAGDLKCPVPVPTDDAEKENAPKSKAAQVSEPISPSPESEDVRDAEETPQAGPDTAALMAALQNNLAAAGGPLAGMDPQQLLQFAMRMLSGEEAEDVAGELADDVLAQHQADDNDNDDEEDGQGEDPADLLAWLARSRGPTGAGASQPMATTVPARPKSPEVRVAKKPLTPPPSEVNHSQNGINGVKSSMVEVGEEQEDAEMEDSTIPEQPQPLSEGTRSTRKRKAAATDEAPSEPAPKKRATRSFNAPTAASRAKAAPAPAAAKSAPKPAAKATAKPAPKPATRSTRSKRS